MREAPGREALQGRNTGLGCLRCGGLRDGECGDPSFKQRQTCLFYGHYTTPSGRHAFVQAHSVLQNGRHFENWELI